VGLELEWSWDGCFDRLCYSATGWKRIVMELNRLLR